LNRIFNFRFHPQSKLESGRRGFHELRHAEALLD
jgi:hypothetical protein